MGTAKQKARDVRPGDEIVVNGKPPEKVRLVRNTGASTRIETPTSSRTFRPTEIIDVVLSGDG